MTINTSDLKWKQSERLTDNDDGGGLMTATEIVDGEVNNLLPDISRIDRTAGRVNLRKPFAHVATGNTDILYGAHAIVSAPPADPNVSLTLFSTGVAADERAYAQERIERYLGLGTRQTPVLFGDHYEGQRVINLMAPVDVAVPIVGDTIVLRVAATAATEYLRIADVSSEVREFVTEEGGTRIFKRRIIIVESFQPLQADYAGEQPSYYSILEPATEVYGVVVADAAKYYGITRLADAAAPGDKTITVDSIFTRVVPATESEIPVIDARASGDLVQYVAAGDEYQITRSAAGDVPATAEAYFDRAMRPGSIRVELISGGSAQYTLIDDGAGNLIPEPGKSQRSTPAYSFGTADYESGRCVLQFAAGGTHTSSWQMRITATPAAVLTEAGWTASQEVTLANRGYNWLKALRPRPAPGLVAVSYRSLGRWYTLIDDGRGKLSSGISGEGTGTVDYATGSASLTTGYLPDVDTKLIWSWGTGVDTRRIDDDDARLSRVRIEVTVPDGPIDPGSVEVDYLVGGVTQTAIDDGAGGFSDDDDGLINYARGNIELYPAQVPDSASSVTVRYDSLARETYTESSPTPNGSGQISIALGEAVEAGTYTARLSLDYEVATGTETRTTDYVDDGAGNILAVVYDQTSGRNTASEAAGTINYATGAVTLETELPFTRLVWVDDGFVSEWQSEAATTSFGGGDVTGLYAPGGGAAAQTETQVISSLKGDLLGDPALRLVSDGARLQLGGNIYVDRGGTLYRAVDPATNAGTAAGTLDLANGNFELTSWAGGGDNDPAVLAALGYIGQATMKSIAFRIPVPVLRSQSLSVRATTEGGSESIANSDAGGNVNGGVITGTVDYQTALAELEFSAPVLPSSIVYNAVGIKYIPLSEDVLKLDPIRLPQDGRVPIFRPADMVVIHHTESEQLDAPLSAGESVDLSRGPVSKLWLRDENGLVIPPELYTADLTTTPATITFADPLDLSAYQQPLVAEHRIEQMRLVEEAQIGGQITLQTELGANFPADETFVSTILLFGELQARVAYLFTQKTWTNEWENARIGDDSIAKYNDVAFPLAINNRNGITERWAVIFTSSTEFYVLGETVGVVATGSTSADCAPVNPFTEEPYFTVAAGGWGAGWVSNNVLRFNTVGAYAPVWVIRTTQAGDATVTNDEGRIEFRGDAD